MERKAAEVFMAFALERAYTKNEILELYVIPFILEMDITVLKMLAKVFRKRTRRPD